MNTARFLGITDERDTCECCGKTNLKRAVALEIDGVDVYYGTTCAARALKMPAREVTSRARAAQRERDAEIARARDEVRSAEDARWQAFLDARAPGLDRFRQIETFGGYYAARAAYKAAA